MYQSHIILHSNLMHHRKRISGEHTIVGGPAYSMHSSQMHDDLVIHIVLHEGKSKLVVYYKYIE